MDVLWSYLTPHRVGGPAARKGIGSSATPPPPSSAGVQHLVLVFIAWKVLLLLVACASPGRGYDTSTQLLLDQSSNGQTEQYNFFALVFQHVISRLTRWDAIYFTRSSERGYVHEQEWAFSWALTRLMSRLAKVLPLTSSLPDVYSHALAGILTAHVSHLLSAILLYFLALEILPYKFHERTEIAYTTAVLHVLSPAGLFLSSPYGESTFALLNFAGMLCYASATSSKIFEPNHVTEGSWTIVAGLCFGTASMIRGNGLLSGLVFAWDALAALPNLPRILKSFSEISRLASTVIAGLAVAIGYALPQVIAYQEYCTGGNSRPWCTTIPPTIYTFVQSHYWNVGFLRYWTLSNLPLFLLAAPMLFVLVTTAIAAILPSIKASTTNATSETDPEGTKARLQDRTQRLFTHCAARFALPQLVLAALALTNFHVQIINRISSGYPVWYMVMAMALHSSGRGGKAGPPAFTGAYGVNLNTLQWAVRGMVMYAIVQGGLYASFLPPA